MILDLGINQKLSKSRSKILITAIIIINLMYLRLTF